jgi:hypothetical protein
MSFVQRRSEDTRKYIFYLFALIAAAISAVTVIIAQLSWRGWIAAMRGFLQGEGPFMPLSQPITPELSRSLAMSRSSSGIWKRAPRARRKPCELDAEGAANGAPRGACW